MSARAAGAFRSLQDFIARSDKRQVNARTVEALVKCGAFDSMGHNRPSLLDALPRVMEIAGSARRVEGEEAQASLFDMMSEEDTAGLQAEIPIPRLPNWSDKQRLDTEKELAGFYLSGHPLERFEPDFEAFSTVTAAEAARMPKGENAEWVGLVKRLVPRTDRNGRMFAFAECEDRTGSLECTFFADAFAKARPFLREGSVIWVSGRIDIWKDTRKVLVNDAKPIDQVRADRIRALEVRMPWGQVTEANLTRLREILARHKGRRKLWVMFAENGHEARVEADGRFGVTPSTDLIRALQDEPVITAVRFRV